MSTNLDGGHVNSVVCTILRARTKRFVVVVVSLHPRADSDMQYRRPIMLSAMATVMPLLLFFAAQHRQVNATLSRRKIARKLIAPHRQASGKSGNMYRTLNPSEAPTISFAPTMSNQPSTTPSQSPTIAPSSRPSQPPTPAPSQIPSNVPTSAPTVSHAPTVTPHPTATEYERIQTISSEGDEFYTTRCEASPEMEMGTVTDQLVAFDYQLILIDANVDPASKISWIEGRLNAFLSRYYMGECDFNRTDFQTLSMSSSPIDTVGPTCSDGTTNCFIINGGIIAQLFYNQRRRQRQQRQLLKETITDLIVSESFGRALLEAFDSDDGMVSKADPDIVSVDFVALTNSVVLSSGATFGGVDPGNVAGLTDERSQMNQNSNTNVAWATTFLSFTIIGLIATVLVVIRRRQRTTQSKAALDETERRHSGEAVQEVSKLDESIDASGIYNNFEEEEPEASMLQDNEIEDYMTDTGGSFYSTHTGFEVTPTFSRVHANTPESIISNGESQYDPYGSTNHNTPDTLDL